ncbi:MAG: PAS domain S-box protein [Alphaproteobacteria bacterium]|nr:MAG: PAS domain S-box protein [Alphaproteobacteria bacterium]
MADIVKSNGGGPEPDAQRNNSALKTAGACAAVAAAYFAAARLGLSFAFGAEQVTAVWPPSGIALAALIMLGARVWPGVLAGAYFANILANEPAAVAVFISIGNTLEAVAGAWMLRRFAAFDRGFPRQKDVLALVLFSAEISTAIAATIGVAALCLGKVQPWGDAAQLWLLWWLGDAAGIIIVAPLFLIWAGKPVAMPFRPGQTIAEGFMMLTCLVAACVAALALGVVPGIAVFPFVVWAALRFGPYGTTLVTLIAAGILMTGTIHGAGLFAGHSLNTSLMQLQAFMAVVGVTGLSLGTAISARNEAEQRLQESKERIELIVDHAMDAIVAIDRDGIITEWNAQAESLFGWLRREALGKKMAELIIPPSHREAHDRGFKNFLAGGAPRILNTRVEMAGLDRHRNHIPIELTVTSQTVRGKVYFTAFIRDISGVREAQVAKSHLAAIVESSDDGIISEDLSGVITFWNRGAERIFGYAPHEAVGRNINMIIPAERADEEPHILSQIRAGSPIDHFETVRVDKQGRPIDVSISVSPLHDETGRVTGASKILRDVSHRKMAETQLLHYMRDLERSNQELDEFAHIASHDLREPLRGLTIQSEILAEEYRDKLGKEGAQRLERLSTLCRRMDGIIKDLLHYARLGGGEFAIQEADMNEIVRDVRQTMETYLKDQNAEVVVPKPLPSIACDKARVTEVMRNLITNGVRHNDKKKKRIEVGFIGHMAAPHGQEKNVFYVRDNGRGVARENYDEIFGIFRRIPHKGDKGEQGSGVGLTFVKKIIQRHGGNIWLDSTVGEGATFYFTLNSIR